MSLLREALVYYRDLKRQEKQRKLLINKNANFGLLEQLVQRCNDNPQLRIHVTTVDGTNLELYTYKPKRNLYGTIDGDEYIN